MQSRLRIAGHGMQPLLLMFPLGLFWTAFVFDLATLLGAPALIGTVAFWNLVAGLGGGLLATLTAGFDAATAAGPAARIFVLALLLDAGVLITFAVLTLMRVRDPDRTVNAGLLLVEVAGLAAAGFSAWFGGRLADPRAPVADPRPPRAAGPRADGLLSGGRLDTGHAERPPAGHPPAAHPADGPRVPRQAGFRQRLIAAGRRSSQPASSSLVR
ncbi:hypothetical protein Ait01nite_048200 [Actinoplanes italicus]|uniref:Putative membrane protein n=1 Tax=Actinoplanes italicus TaxID=113567 RepID=A0A2T0K9U9_9ACTN|nr:DUF2231 domain-containing protein [Actinoplanes italicus]PRX19922.1 putative membrane protein [Actinoplanes italicus]GIE31775.1 hypothetical protein Ait01nite_048200 [Actinoplanes italicus]